MATSNNPRKFSEKIALHNQKQAEETAAFEEVMKDLSITRAARLQSAQYLQLGPNRGQCYGGSLPNVNQIGSTSVVDMPFQTLFPSSEVDGSRTTRQRGLVDRVYRDRSRLAAPNHKPVDKHGRQIDSCPYASVYLSPPSDTSWRRTNSDSALHQSTLPSAQQISFTGGLQELHPKRFLLLTVPGSESVKQEDDNDEQTQNWNCKKNVSRSKNCRVPGINIFPSPDQELHAPLAPAAHNTGGSLPDLTNIQFPSPLPTPLDTDNASLLTSANDMGNLSDTQVGVITSQSTVTMAMQTGQDDTLILNTEDSLQLSPTLSPPLTLTQAAMNAMALEQQLFQYAFFSQQASAQMQHSQLTGMDQLQDQQSSASTPGPMQTSPQNNMVVDINIASSLQQYRSRAGSSSNQSPTSPVSNQGFSPGGSPQHNSILGSMFADFYDQQLTSMQASALSQQLEQFNMMEASDGPSGPYNQASTLSYTQAASLGLTVGSPCSNLQDHQQVAYSSHGNIPNIVLTVSGESPPCLPKDLASLCADVGGFEDADCPFPLDELRIDPLTLDGLHLLHDPDVLLADPATEDAFRMDRL